MEKKTELQKSHCICYIAKESLHLLHCRKNMVSLHIIVVGSLDCGVDSVWLDRAGERRHSVDGEQSLPQNGPVVHGNSTNVTTRDDWMPRREGKAKQQEWQHERKVFSWFREKEENTAKIRSGWRTNYLSSLTSSAYRQWTLELSPARVWWVPRQARARHFLPTEVTAKTRAWCCLKTNKQTTNKKCAN